MMLSWLAWSGASRAGEQARRALETVARDANDKVDRNLFERYGDAQAFASNPVVRDRTQWYRVGSGQNAIVGAANRYAALYGLYPEMLVVDGAGKLIATNDRDAGGGVVQSEHLYEKNFAGERWFQDAMAGQFLRAEGSPLTGTVVLDLEEREGRKQITFAAPVLGPDQKPIAVWCNRADFGVVEEIVRATHQDLKMRGYASARITVRRSNGELLAEFPPEKALAKGILVEAGSRGALGYAGLGWKLGIEVAEEELMSNAFQLRREVMAVTAGCVLLLLGGAWLVNRGIANPLYAAREELTAEVSELRKSSRELAGVSESLAHCAEEQGASVDRTSSAITEINGIVRRGKNMSAEVYENMTVFERLVSQSRTQLNGVNDSMERIHETARQLTTVLRGIEEVAFQANLLALNASVEAARAGEAGSGFAVVAEAFRGLAQKAGDSAKKSYGYIEAQRTQSEETREAVANLRRGFESVSQRVVALTRMSEEAAAAIAQETTGVHEVDHALTTIHQAATRTAEGAQTNRRFSEELTVQAERTAEVVTKLGSLLDGGAATQTTAGAVRD